MSDETSESGAHAGDEGVGEPEVDPDLDAIDESIDAAEHALGEARARLAQVPAQVVVTNHVMGLYELAAIHLSTTPPDLVSAALAIDAVGCLVEGLGDRIGDDAPTMRDALANIRIAFVQVKSARAADGEG